MMTTRSLYTTGRGFSLIELLVSVGILVVLLGILTPVLMSARVTAKELAVLSHQKSTGVELLSYVGDHMGMFPYFGAPGTNTSHITPSPQPTGSVGHYPRGAYWDQPYYWWWVLELRGYNGLLARQGPEFDPDWHERVLHGEQAVGHAVALDTLTFTVFANPKYFHRDDPQSPVDHHPQRIHTFASPSLKGLLLRHNWVRDFGGVELKNFAFFSDGHGRIISLDEMNRAVSIRRVGSATPVLTTENGVLGRDI